jgi:NAD(P)-dependent dehydrogenase (short-subunit alcohol dehydrogenase family)
MSFRSVLPFPSNPNNFSAASIPDLGGKTILVTGGNTGIGYETCLECCRKGAHVYLAARSEQRATDAIEKIKKEIPQAKITFLKLDLQDLKQVQSAAQEFKGRESKLDVLVNNAGIMACPFELTKDGIESQFATNHVGHFLLTRELLPSLEKAAPSRVVNLSSIAHISHPKGGIDFENINNPDAMNNATRYGQSKLANMLFSAGLDKRYGDKIYVNSVHPGFVHTELIRGVKQSSSILGAMGSFVSSIIALTPKQGALTSLYCATSPDIVAKNLKNKYFIPIAQLDTPRPIGQDLSLADKLWEFTEKLVNEKLSK